jgi:hypothetical protein
MYHKNRYAAAARFFADARAHDRERGQSVSKGRNYDAAVCAAFAAPGHGEDPPPEDKERARLRKEALELLQGELEPLKKKAESPDIRERQRAWNALDGWRSTYNFAEVRDKIGLDQLTPAERVAWSQFWAQVTEMMNRAAKRP